MFIGIRLLGLIVTVIEIYIFSLSKANNNCEGKPHNCCEGFMWNISEKDCIRCNIGYYGVNCSSPCPAPTFGLGCQSRCTCHKDSCNHIYGCMLERGSTENSTQSTAGSLRKSSMSMNSMVTFGISSLAIFSTLIFIVHIGLKVFPRIKKADRPLEIEMMDLDQSKNNSSKI